LPLDHLEVVALALLGGKNIHGMVGILALGRLAKKEIRNIEGESVLLDEVVVDGELVWTSGCCFDKREFMVLEAELVPLDNERDRSIEGGACTP
jgi:hypothetical protein